MSYASKMLCTNSVFSLVSFCIMTICVKHGFDSAYAVFAIVFLINVISFIVHAVISIWQDS